MVNLVFFLLGYVFASSRGSSDVRRRSNIQRCRLSLNKVCLWVCYVFLLPCYYLLFDCVFSDSIQTNLFVYALILVHNGLSQFPENLFNSAGLSFQRKALFPVGFSFQGLHVTRQLCSSLCITLSCSMKSFSVKKKFDTSNLSCNDNLGFCLDTHLSPMTIDYISKLKTIIFNYDKQKRSKINITLLSNHQFIIILLYTN